MKTFEGFLKWKKKKDPYQGWLDMIHEMDEERKKLDNAIASLEETEKQLKDKMFQSLPKEKQEEILDKQKKNREEIEKQKAELEARMKDIDPYGEEEWDGKVDKEWDWLEDEDDENLMKRHLNTITKAKHHIKRIVGEE